MRYLGLSSIQEAELFKVREIHLTKGDALGKSRVDVYGNLEGFPSEEEQPECCPMLSNIGELTKKPNTKVLDAVSDKGEVLGGFVYFQTCAHMAPEGQRHPGKMHPDFDCLQLPETFEEVALEKP